MIDLSVPTAFLVPTIRSFAAIPNQHLYSGKNSSGLPLRVDLDGKSDQIGFLYSVIYIQTALVSARYSNFTESITFPPVLLCVFLEHQFL